MSNNACKAGYDHLQMPYSPVPEYIWVEVGSSKNATPSFLHVGADAARARKATA